MPNGIVRLGGWECNAALAGVFGVAFERAPYEVARAKTHGESERKDDAAEEDAEGQFHHIAADLEVVKDHGCGEHEHEPLDAKRKETPV